MNLLHRDQETLRPYPRWTNFLAGRLGSAALTAPFSKELLRSPKTPEDDALRLQISSAIELLSQEGVSPRQKQKAWQFAVAKSHELIVEILPPDPMLMGDHQPAREPSLAEVYLLAQTADATNDYITFEALGYILDTAPPVFSEELTKAYHEAASTNQPIMQVLTRLLDQSDTKRDRPKDISELELVLALREATPPKWQNTTWEERVRQAEEVS